jgi:hypothetical protein
MPLQVIFSTSSKPPEPITLVSAGEDQFTFCSEEITLQAVLIGPLVGHTFLWEQVSGNEIGVNITNASFTNCNGLPEITEVTIPVGNAQANFSGGEYWELTAVGTPYYVWYTLDGGGADPAPGGRTAVSGGPVALVTGDSDVTVRIKTAAAISGEADFTTGEAGLIVTVTNVTFGEVNDAVDVTAGVGINVTQDGEFEACVPGPDDEPTLFYFNSEITGGTFDDKTWKFTVDKGQPLEQVAFTTVFGAPFARMDAGRPDRNCRTNLGLGYQCRTPALKTIRNFPPVPIDPILAECDSTSYVLQWSVECDEDKIVGFIVEEKSVAGPFSVTTVLGPDERFFFATVLSRTYRVVAVYDDFITFPTVRPGVTGAISEIPSNTVWTEPDPANHVELFDEKVSALGQAHGGGQAATEDYLNVSRYNIVLLTLLNACADDITDTDASGQAATEDYINISRFNVVLLTLITACADGLTDTDSGGEAATEDYIDVSRYNVQDLRGGDIGG